MRNSAFTYFVSEYLKFPILDLCLGYVSGLLRLPINVIASIEEVFQILQGDLLPSQDEEAPREECFHIPSSSSGF